MKWKLPKPRVFGWQMKTLDTAKTSFRILPYGSYEACIEHDIIKGCTVDMIEWWFKNIGGDMEYNGKRYSRYLVWHPEDHIYWGLIKGDANGKAGVGAKFRIVEAFNGNSKWMIDTIEDVTKLDNTGIRLRRKIFGLEAYSLEHWFVPHHAGTRYSSRLQVGSETLIGRWIINPLIHKFVMTEVMTKKWLKHNIEEVGNFEFFLPDLFNRENNR